MTRSATCWFLAEGMSLAQEEIHERGLAVVHVRNDGDVAEVSAFR